MIVDHWLLAALVADTKARAIVPAPGSFPF